LRWERGELAEGGGWGSLFETARATVTRWREDKKKSAGMSVGACCAARRLPLIAREV